MNWNDAGGEIEFKQKAEVTRKQHNANHFTHDKRLLPKKDKWKWHAKQKHTQTHTRTHSDKYTTAQNTGHRCFYFFVLFSSQPQLSEAKSILRMRFEKIETKAECSVGKWKRTWKGAVSISGEVQIGARAKQCKAWAMHDTWWWRHARCIRWMVLYQMMKMNNVGTRNEMKWIVFMCNWKICLLRTLYHYHMVGWLLAPFSVLLFLLQSPTLASFIWFFLSRNFIWFYRKNCSVRPTERWFHIHLLDFHFLDGNHVVDCIGILKCSFSNGILLLLFPRSL